MHSDSSVPGSSVRIMTNANPYSTPATLEGQHSVPGLPSTKRLWMAYGIAPLIAPLLAAITVFVGGLVYQSTHTEDIEVNPMSLIFAPLFVFIAGVPISYGLAGIVGMPIAFLLRKQNKLNGYTVHGAAILLAALLGVLIPVVELLMQTSEAGKYPGIIEFLTGGFVVFLVVAPFILLSATTFWLVGVRRRKQ